jgi:hypothetical protein
MAKFDRIAGMLGLEDVGEIRIGDRTCPDCRTGLRLGKDRQGNIDSYCPKCLKTIATVFTPRVGARRRVPPHDD